MTERESETSSKRCKLVTFGCKVNQYESQAIQEDLVDHGYDVVNGEEDADLVVVNTCTVTHQADRKARKAIYRAAREEPDARLVVVGCYAENTPDDLREIDGVDDVYPHVDKSRVGALIAGEADTDKEPDPDGMVQQSVSGLDRHTRAWVKIEDGCNLFCNFCIIPFVRGRPRSKDPDDVIEEIHQLEREGYNEVVLTGIHVGCYGQDLGDGVTLASLFQRIDEECDIARVRLSSVEADEINRELLQTIKDSSRIVPHLHVPLQSGSDFILKRMNRRYDVDEFRRKMAMVKEVLDQPAVTTDVIAGFPGETTADFDETLSLCREVGFSGIHVFSYSDREGTRAADMEPKVDPDVINHRVDQLERLSSLLKNEFQKNFKGEEVLVLAEHHASSENELVGLTPRYLRVKFRAPKQLTNRILRVQVEEVEGDIVRGRFKRIADPEDLPDAG
jgi:threonylcarbamoyladenosine tRNA methylthiotransferase MtaB